MAKASKETIDGWKKKYPKGIFEITVEDENKGVALEYFYAKKPSRTEMSAAMTAGKKSDIKMAEVITKNIIISDNKDLLENDDYFFAVVNQLEEILEPARATIKKL